MVRRITIDEAAANFKDIIEHALENGDSLELERDGRMIGTLRLEMPELPRSKLMLGEFFKLLADHAPTDPTFADDLEEAMRYMRSDVARDKWES